MEQGVRFPLLDQPIEPTTVRAAMARLSASLLLIWTLLLGPALCMGEQLEHACDCGSEETCEHEDACAQDPCGSLARPDEDAFATWDLSIPALAALPVQVLNHGEFALRRTGVPRALPPPGRANLPYAKSDRPLLI